MDFDGGFRCFRGGAWMMTVRGVVFDEVKALGFLTKLLADQKFKAGFCRLELETFALQMLHGGQDFLNFRTSLCQSHAHALSFHQHVRLTCHV